jgi:UDP-N-acetylmuramate dehydrogenase
VSTPTGAPDPDPRSDPVGALRARCTGRVRAGVSLSGFTTLKVGGAARVLVEAEQEADLVAVGDVAAAAGLPTLVVGRGSNMLVADAGFPGIVVALGRGFRGVEVHVDGERVRARAGAAEPLPALAVRLADAGCGGVAWAAAVPGSLGGAVRMNAGAHGGELADHLVEAEVFRLSSRTRETWTREALGMRYRRTALPRDAVVLGATLAFDLADADTIREEIAEIRAWRRAHQPINQPNCGSVFTNPPGDSAGRLIDAAGCKGLRVGGAAVSELHANFIVTEPGARSSDVRDLIAEVRHRVAQVHGVDLHPEVVVVDVGETGHDPDEREGRGG